MQLNSEEPIFNSEQRILSAQILFRNNDHNSLIKDIIKSFINISIYADGKKTCRNRAANASFRSPVSAPKQHYTA